MNYKKWKILDFSEHTSYMIRHSVCSLSAKVLAARIGTVSEKEIFSRDNFLYSPFDLTDMDRAVERINSALINDEKIAVYGDYDTDGVTATVILYSYLEAMGADVVFYIPDREGEGYGLNREAIEHLCNEGCNLIVTVDNGIAAVDEIEYAKSLGLDVVVTDHHKPQGVIPNCIVVDPHREDCESTFKDICGAFVAFKLVAALDGGEYDGAFDEFAELVAIATIADIVPLVSENRTIVKLGLEKIKNTDNLGLLALARASLSPDSDINSTAVTYSIVPRINAAGRMGSAKRAAELLLCSDEDRAEALCSEICSENNKRKDIENDILEEIEQLFYKTPEIFSQRIIVVKGKNWHHGVLGIVASKLVEKYLRPAIVLSDDDGELTGSGRSVEGFSLFDAVIFSKDTLTRFGGHSLAVGVSLKGENFDAFCRTINDYAASNYAYMPINCVCADAVISPEEITIQAVKELNMFEPFGKDNSAPSFALLSLSVQKIASIGNGKHTRLTLLGEGGQFTCVCFGKSADEFKIYDGKKVDIIVRLKIGSYMGNESVTIQLVSIRPSGIDDELFFKEIQLFDAVMRKDGLSDAQARHLMPSYDEAKALYRTVRALSGLSVSDDEIWHLAGRNINRARVSAVMKAFEQSGLVTRQNGQISISQVSEKKDLFSSEILKYISGFLHS